MVVELAILLGVVAIGAASVTIYWTKILHWAQQSLLPWVDQNLPELSADVRQALVTIDSVVTPVRAMVKAAWQRVRQRLLQQIAEFEQLSNDRWLVRITSWLRVTLEALDPAPVVKRIQTEQVIAYDELPPEVREQLLRKGQTTHRIDVRQARDVELGLVLAT